MAADKAQFWAGMRSGFPVAIGYLPYGIAYGLIAKNANFDLFQTLLMSVTVYAGTAQFIAIAMLEAAQPALSIMLTVLIVNLRYVLMMSALLPAMRAWKQFSRFCVSFYVSDETFVVLSNHADKQKLSVSYAWGVNSVALFGWLLSNIIGFLAGNYFDLKRFGFDFALTAVLVALATLMMKGRSSVGVGILSGVLVMLFYLSGLEKVSILIAAILASAVGVVATWKRTKSI